MATGLNIRTGFFSIDSKDWENIFNSSIVSKHAFSNNIIKNHIFNNQDIREKMWSSSTACAALFANSTVRGEVFANSTYSTEMWASSIARAALWANSSARSEMWASATACTALFANSTAYGEVLANSTYRSEMWNSLIARTAIYNASACQNDILPYLKTDVSHANISSATTDGGTEDWTAVENADGENYMAYIEFHSTSIYDWYDGYIENSDGTDMLHLVGGSGQSKSGNAVTTDGLKIWFNDNASNFSSSSYARAYWIKV